MYRYLKLIEVEGLNIFVENEAVGERVSEALRQAEASRWYAPSAEKVVLYGKYCTQTGDIIITALDLISLSKEIDSIIYYGRNGSPHHIHITTLNATSLYDKFLHELGHGTLELGNSHLTSYSPEALQYKERLRVALCQDYHIYTGKRSSLLPEQQHVAKLLFKLPRGPLYSIKNYTAEHICHGLQALAFSEPACYELAPAYTQVLNEYVNFEMNKKLMPDKLNLTPKAPRVIYPDEIQLPNKPAKAGSCSDAKSVGNLNPVALNKSTNSRIKSLLPHQTQTSSRWDIAKITKNAFKLTIYNVAVNTHHAYQTYNYLEEENPVLHKVTVAGVVLGEIGFQSLFWSTLFVANLALVMLLKVASLVVYTPDSNAAFQSAWKELTEEDFVKPTPEETSDYLEKYLRQCM